MRNKNPYVMFNLSHFRAWNDHRVVTFFETVQSSLAYSYADLYRDALELSQSLNELQQNAAKEFSYSSQRINVAILLPVHSPALIPIIVGIEHASCVSCFLDAKMNGVDIKKCLKDCQSNVLLCEQRILAESDAYCQNIKITKKITLFGVDCALIYVNESNSIRKSDDCYDNKTESSNIFFYATTSGSCGEVKPIGVTYKCFQPNITSLGRLYGLTTLDVLFVSSPPTFDPFMVDICLALTTGASLIMTSNTLRCNAAQLLNILFPISEKSRVTIMQTTPSLFMRWSLNDISTRIFGGDCQLRILSFGGETFPATSVINKWTNWALNHRPRIFNLYGLTEMSCWATVYELSHSDILENRRIPIGQPIDEHTTLDVSADGELLLKSKVRKCFQPQLNWAQVLDDTFEVVLHTGDMVEIDDKSQIHFSSRSNAIIKFYGQKINLAEIEVRAKHIDDVEEAICLHDEPNNRILLFVKIENRTVDVKWRIIKAVQTFGVHVKIECVSKFPLTKHGKVSRRELLNLACIEPTDELKPFVLIFQELLNEILGINIEFSISGPSPPKKSKNELESSFIHLGGTSLKAIQIIDEIEKITSKSIPQMLPMLLNDRIPVREIFALLLEKNSIKSNHGEADLDEIPMEIIPRWTVNMKKCIDATPTVCSLDGLTVVSVGSHSKLIYNISIDSGEIISQLELPDRIESQVTQFGDYGIVGCYDGYLYCFNIQTGDIKWKFNSGAMIKCQALILVSCVIFGNYNETNNLWCLGVEEGEMIWSIRIGTKSIYANPIRLDTEHCLVCTLDGTVAAINWHSPHLTWVFKADAPIFSTPSVTNTGSLRVVLAAVNGKIYILNSDGVPLWSHQIDGNIFSPIKYFINDEKHINFVFGSQNHYLYCFAVDTDTRCKEVWRCKTTASIRSSAVFVSKGQKHYALIFSSDGIVNSIDCDTGILNNQRQIDGDVFSTPVRCNQNLIIGSRNDFLYCINLDSVI